MATVTPTYSIVQGSHGRSIDVTMAGFNNDVDLSSVILASKLNSEGLVGVPRSASGRAIQTAGTTDTVSVKAEGSQINTAASFKEILEIVNADAAAPPAWIQSSDFFVAGYTFFRVDIVTVGAGNTLTVIIRFSS